MEKGTYEADYRFYPGRPDLVTRIRVYRSLPGAIDVPYATAFPFGSGPPDPPREDGLGEVPGTRNWVANNPTTCLGVHVLGLPSSWAGQADASEALPSPPPCECPEEPPPVTDDCITCHAGAYMYYHVTIEGATGPLAAWNGVWLLGYDDLATCTWSGIVNDTFTQMTAVDFPATAMHLALGPFDDPALYVGSITDGECLRSWDAVKEFGSADWPATVLITPAQSPE